MFYTHFVFSERKFVAPVLKFQPSGLDIDNIFNSQQPSTFSAGTKQTFVSQKNPRCFEVPFVAKTSAPQPRPKNPIPHFSSHAELSSENASKVESFIQKVGGASGHTVKSNFKNLNPRNPLLRNDSPAHFSNLDFLPSQLGIVPETPKLDKFSSHDLSSTRPDIIEDSVDECKGEINGPCLQTPGNLTLPPIINPGGGRGIKDGVQLRSVEEIRILLFNSRSK